MPTTQPPARPVRVALFGAGARGLQCLAALRADTRFEIACFFDNDPKKWDTSIHGIAVCEPTAEACDQVDAIILASIHAKEIFAQLTRLGYAGKVALSPPHLARRFGAGAATSSNGAASGGVGEHDRRRDQLLSEASAAVRALANELDRDPPRARSSTSAFTREVACTICCNNYLAYASVLARSFLRHHPEGRFFICLADRRREDVEYPSDDRIDIVDAASLGIEHFESVAFKYDVLELNTAIKPFLLERLLRDEQVERLLYLDPDILVLAPLDDLFEQLARTPLVLTPHLTQPYRDDYHPREIDILRAGTFNLGFVGLAAHSQTWHLLSWWQERLYDGCTREVDKGYFVDQKWMDLVPSFFPEHLVVRHPGYNAAYWNLHERNVGFDGERFEVNGRPLRFFHFSGVDVDDLDSVSKHQNRITLPAEGALRDLFELYRVLLLTHGHLARRSTPYAYAQFDNGVRIPEIVRTIYREARLARAYDQPFTTAGASSFYRWLRAPWRPDSLISNLFAALHARAPELRAAYPSLEGAGELGLVLHMSTAAELYGLPSELVDDDPRRLAAQMEPPDPTSAPAGRAVATDAMRLTRRAPRRHSAVRTEHHRQEPAVIRMMEGADRSTTVFTAALASLVARSARELSDPRASRTRAPGRQGSGTFVIAPVEISPRGHAPGQADVAYWMWDEAWTPDAWPSRASEIWVPSAYSLEGLSRVANVPVVDMPLPVGLIAPSAAVRGTFGLPDEGLLFVTVIDPVTERGHDPRDTVRAFQDAFGSNHVSSRQTLVVVATDPDIARGVRQRVTPIVTATDALVVRQIPPGPDLVQLLRLSDCYVSVHGSVAFDLWLAYALWYGRSAVVTHAAGTMDIATVNNTFPVGVVRGECSGGVGSRPDLAHASSLLRLVAESRRERRDRGVRARREVRAILSVDAVAARVAGRLPLVGSHRARWPPDTSVGAA